MKKFSLIAITVFIMLGITSYASAYDLVLVHGLTNKYQWSDSFLDKCLQKYGSGNVYAIYTNTSTRVWTRTINGRTMRYCGENDYSAGDTSVATQASRMRTKTQLLQSSYGLSTKFKIIAHSMGGLVSRRYIYNNPNTVAGLVTLGTPHQGSALAYQGDWVDFFIGADAAVDNLKPSWVQGTFNVQYPAPGPMADNGKIYTIGGDADGWDAWGWAGELSIGWTLLSTLYWTDSDGGVPRDADRISGSTFICRFWSYDHKELVTKSAVADKALQYLAP